MEQLLNRDLLPHNQCFGCGLENVAGLRTEVSPDPGSPETLRARFHPSEAMAGFPGMTHGGAIYTALDCLSTWVATALGPTVERPGSYGRPRLSITRSEERRV